MFLRTLSLWAVLLLLHFDHAAVLHTNLTTSTNPEATIVGSAPSTITPSATLSYANIQSTTELFPVTPGPYWGNQTIPINTCTSWNLGGITPQLVWTPCHIFAGTVQLSYFPPASGNITYPSTYYNEAIGITMTSPSMYMVIYTISGYNSCGQVGPTMSNIVISMNPSDVSTIALYTASDQQVNTTPAKLLTLNDIISGCSTITMTEASTNGAIQNLHAMANDYNRCFPALAIPTPQIESLGLPYYRHCGQDNARLGLFDPPGAIPPANGLLPVTSASPATSSSIPASTAQSPSLNQPSKTATAKALLPNSSNSTAQGQESKPASLDPIAPSVKAASSNVLSTAVLADQDPITTVNSPQPESLTAVVPANTPLPIVTIASLTMAAGGETVSANPGASTLVIADQTITSGALSITLSDNSVASLGAQGLAVQASDGLASTYNILTLAPNPAITPSPTATLSGETISTRSDANPLLLGSQTLSLNGPAITLSDSDKPVSAYYTTLTNTNTQGLKVIPSSSKSTTLPTELKVPSFQAGNWNENGNGNGNASSNETESAGIKPISNIVFHGGAEKSTRSGGLVSQLSFIVLGIWGLVIGV